MVILSTFESVPRERIGGVILGLILIFISVFLGCICFEIKQESKYFIEGIISAFIFLIFGSYFFAQSASIENDVRYKIYLDDMSYKELTKKYNIIDTDGLIIIAEEKEANKESKK